MAFGLYSYLPSVWSWDRSVNGTGIIPTSHLLGVGPVHGTGIIPTFHLLGVGIGLYMVLGLFLPSICLELG